MTRNERIMLATKEAYDFLALRFQNVVVVNLYGSQNYDMDTEDSDFDFKAIVLPSLDDVIRNRKPVSTVLEFNGGQIDVKDIRLMFDNFKRMNTNFVETLFTEFYVANPKFASDWARVRDLAPTLVRADMRRALNCMCGMALEKDHALCHPYPSKMNLIEKYGYDAKQLSHIMRLRYMMNGFIDGFPYNQLLKPRPEVARMLVNVKTYKEMYAPEEAKQVSKLLCGEMHEIKEQAFAKNDYPVDNACLDALDLIKADMMKTAFTAELLEG